MASQLRVDKIVPVDGTPTGGGGGIVQIVQGSTDNRLETSSQSFVASNLSASITPKFNTSKIFVMISGDCNTNATNNEMFLTIYRSIGGGSFQDLGATASGEYYGFMSARNTGARLHSAVCINYLDSPSTISAVTYKVYVRKTSAGSGNVEFPANNGAEKAYMTLMEVSA